MSTAAKVAMEKQAHPERFCSNPKCLWRVQTRDGAKPCKKHPQAAQPSGEGCAMTMPLDGMQDRWSLDDKVESFERDGVIAKFFECAARRREWTTHLTKGAYRAGFMDGLHGKTLDDNKYRRRLGRGPNFLRGANDPVQAWETGWLDGERVRRILNDAADVRDILFREFQLLPPSMQERALLGANQRADALPSSEALSYGVRCSGCGQYETACTC